MSIRFYKVVAECLTDGLEQSIVGSGIFGFSKDCSSLADDMCGVGKVCGGSPFCRSCPAVHIFARSQPVAQLHAMFPDVAWAVFLHDIS